MKRARDGHPDRKIGMSARVFVYGMMISADTVEKLLFTHLCVVRERSLAEMGMCPCPERAQTDLPETLAR